MENEGGRRGNGPVEIRDGLTGPKYQCLVCTCQLSVKSLARGSIQGSKSSSPGGLARTETPGCLSATTAHTGLSLPGAPRRRSGTQPLPAPPRQAEGARVLWGALALLPSLRLDVLPLFPLFGGCALLGGPDHQGRAAPSMLAGDLSPLPRWILATSTFKTMHVCPHSWTEAHPFSRDFPQREGLSPSRVWPPPCPADRAAGAGGRGPGPLRHQGKEAERGSCRAPSFWNTPSALGPGGLPAEGTGDGGSPVMVTCVLMCLLVTCVLKLGIISHRIVALSGRENGLEAAPSSVSGSVTLKIDV